MRLRDHTPTLEELGITGDESSDAQALDTLKSESPEQHAEVRANRKSIRAAAAAHRRKKRKAATQNWCAGRTSFAPPPTAGKGRPKKGDPAVQSPKDPTPTLEELGLTLNESSDAQALARLKRESPDQHAEVRANRKSLRAAAAAFRRKKRKAKKKAAAAAAAPAPDGGPLSGVVQAATGR